MTDLELRILNDEVKRQGGCFEFRIANLELRKWLNFELNLCNPWLNIIEFSKSSVASVAEFR